MIAVIQTGGKQYLVEQGDVLKIEKIQAQPGDRIFFDALLKAEGESVEIGTPILDSKVHAEILEHGRDAKVSVVKYKPKVRYTRRVGHRQAFTKVKIVEIA